MRGVGELNLKKFRINLPTKVSSFYGAEIHWNFCNTLFRFKVIGKTIVSKIILTVPFLNLKFSYFTVIKGFILRKFGVLGFFIPNTIKKIFLKRKKHFLTVCRTFWTLKNWTIVYTKTGVK